MKTSKTEENSQFRALCNHSKYADECDEPIRITPRLAMLAGVLVADPDTPAELYDVADETLDIWRHGGRFTCWMAHALTSEPQEG